MKDCWLWLYKGLGRMGYWCDWNGCAHGPWASTEKAIYGIFKHQSQKDGVNFQGTDSREFWQQAEKRNRATATLYNKLGLAEYETMETFCKMALLKA